MNGCTIHSEENAMSGVEPVLDMSSEMKINPAEDKENYINIVYSIVLWESFKLAYMVLAFVKLGYYLYI